MTEESLQLVTDDPWLKPYEEDLNKRYDFYQQKYHEIITYHQSLKNYASRDKELGFHFDHEQKGWWYREWAPGAQQLWLIGDFNDWNAVSHPLEKGEEGIWEIFIPNENRQNVLKHGSRVKVKVMANDTYRDRIPAYIERAVQDEQSKDFSGQIWKPLEPFVWRDQSFNPEDIKSPIIYECHLGMAQNKEGIGTYREFADMVLPRIADLGYNCIQLMAIKEHPYYGSFGYHVSNFFAPSSRFGTPEDLKYLVNKAHNNGMAVIMDMVHSHAVKNMAEGLNDFDGSGHQYFHEGGRGYHNGWDSKLFDYSKDEVLRFLLSNARYWIEEFHFDGYRFDGVTSMMYHHHGDHVSFDHYDKYFRDMVDWDAIRYLQLVNVLIHEVKPGAITIAEDMSGMPGISRKVDEGGVGFDYRLGMGIPDYWIKLLKHTQDEDWNIHEIWEVLSNRRWKEKTIAYSESHDQALVGDKTLAFWLMDKEMYWHMSKDDDNIIIDRGMALHKMLRLITATVGGEGYLNFIGNEFGHPEWIDFPRQDNGWSYKYARRQWQLVDSPDLKYQYLNNFDRDMVHMLKDNNVLSSLPAQQLNMDNDNKIIVYERNNLIFIINFNANKSIADYTFRANQPGKFKAALISDAPEYGGHNRVDAETEYHTLKDDKLSVYIPSRTGLVLRKVD
ncbi:alpha-amylase family glycosyl hydrolase [Fulvivirga sediminis]|uniref:1,4-alpha-glucan branching enzyme n=1 Tax=Fulvivirga sediminis TaxID=2803949 RepID=A0A937F8K2_9BACT|nr:alpha-amylase family glycosyl hydrolase [Fulvivirga sediminis]MBL3655968.1 alpha amylase C-terminal domain-containing protein [Fulvivirga sediminis]